MHSFRIALLHFQQNHLQIQVVKISLKLTRWEQLSLEPINF